MRPDASDRELIGGVIHRDPEAAALFVERFYRFIVAIAARYSNTRSSLAENVPQIVIERLWDDDFRRLRMWSGQGDFASYLAPIVKRMAIDYRRSPWYRHTRGSGLPAGDDYGVGPFGIPDDGPDGQASLLAKERAAALVNAMAKLGGRDREVLERKYLREESAAEIAQALGINENAVYQALHRAARNLRSQLMEDAPDLFREQFGADAGGAGVSS